MPAVPDEVLQAARLEAVHRTGLLDTAAEPEFDRLAELAATVLDAPFAFITLVDGRRSFWKSAVGVPLGARRQNTVEESFCQYVIAQPGRLLIDDVREDPRTCENPSIETMGVVAWAGTTLLAPDGQALGSFCVIDDRPRKWTDHDGLALETLAKAATAEIALRASMRAERVLAAAVEDERRVLQDVIARAAVGIVVWEGRELRFRMANALGRSMFPGHGPLLGRSMLDLHPEARAIAEAALLPVLNTGQEMVLDEVAVDVGARRGPPRFYDCVFSPVRTGHAVTGVIGTYLETTESVQRRRVLEDALDDSRRTTEALQTSLLPELPALAGLRSAARYRPADDRLEVGGDFFDLFTAADGSHLALVGDICGKGPRAAAAIASARWALRSEARHRSSPAGLLAHLNDLLLSDKSTTGGVDFITLVVARAVPADDAGYVVRLAFAGHPPALLRTPDGETAVIGASAPMVGAWPDMTWTETEVELPKGGQLVLYTDGLLDAQAPARQLVPADLAAALGHADPDDTAAALLELAAGGRKARDDIALLVIAAT